MGSGEKLQNIVLHPGDHYAGKRPVVISTLLGSCVSACLYDPVARVAGMNHFLLANQRYAKNLPLAITDAGRYGIHAMELLINDMLALGALKGRIKAKAFGGAAVLEILSRNNYACVGDVNVRFIREFLETDRIELVESDLGGEQGRHIDFNTETYEVAVRLIQNSCTTLVETKERGYWKKSINEHRTRPSRITFFE